MYGTLVAALVLFLFLPLVFIRITGGRGEKAQTALVIIAALYWLYNWYLE